MLDDPNAECVRGPTLYKIFSRVVDYSVPYRGLRSVSSKDGRLAGTVAASAESIQKDSLMNPALLDSWLQIGGINANNFYPYSDDEVYVFTKLDHLQFGNGYQPPTASSSWVIYSIVSSDGPKELAHDIFVFDAVSKRLNVLILGARFDNVRLSSLRKVLARVNGRTLTKDIRPELPKERPSSDRLPTAEKPVTDSNDSQDVAVDATQSIFKEVRVLFERVADVPQKNVQLHMTTDDLGIDSLMMMEVISELSSHFGIDLPVADVEQLTTVNDLTSYLERRGCGGQTSASSSTSSSVTSGSSSVESSSTPPSSGTSSPPQREAAEDFEQLGKLLQEHLELSSLPKPDDNLADLGLDSLLAIELGSDMEKLFSTTIDLYQIDGSSTVSDLATLAGLTVKTSVQSDHSSGVEESSKPAPELGGSHPEKVVQENVGREDRTPSVVAVVANVSNAYDVFIKHRLEFDVLSKEEGFEDFWRVVYPDQARLVLSYIAAAFQKLGCNLADIGSGESLRIPKVLDKHKHLLARMLHILAEGKYLIASGGATYIRTTKALDIKKPQPLLEELISKYPIHAPEHRLLNVSGSRLAECLTGKIDPLALLFANRSNRELLGNVYDLAPMCRATTRLLANYLEQAFPKNDRGEVYHFLEVGGGTGRHQDPLSRISTCAKD